MPTPRTSTICARIPESVKEGLQEIADFFDMSVSDVIVRFSRDGIAKFHASSMKVDLRLPSVSEEYGITCTKRLK